MNRKRRRHVLGLLAIAVVLVASAVAAKTRPLWRSTARFVPFPADPRVLYEPGAEEAAAVVAAALPAAMAQVEAAHYRPFVAPVRVYVCASLDTFESYGSPRTAGGNLIHGRLFLSPKPENTRERLPRVLTHELSHLQIHQQLGPWQSAALPVWFNEGMGTLVSGGAGAEGVSDEEARRAIVEGRTFTPTGSEGAFSHATASHYGISAHLFYRQAALFLAYLESTEPARFQRFLLAIEDGALLATAFRSAYDRDVKDAWNDFVASVRDR